MTGNNSLKQDKVSPRSSSISLNVDHYHTRINDEFTNTLLDQRCVRYQNDQCYVGLFTPRCVGGELGRKMCFIVVPACLILKLS